jgi:hypothetical protein
MDHTDNPCDRSKATEPTDHLRTNNLHRKGSVHCSTALFLKFVVCFTFWAHLETGNHESKSKSL